MKWLGYKTHITFWHHVVDRTLLVDKECLTDHMHIDAIILVRVQNIDSIFLDFKTIKLMTENILWPLRAETGTIKPKFNNDTTHHVGNSEGQRKPNNVKSVNEVWNVKDASAEYMISRIQKEVQLALEQQGYGERKVKVHFQETSKYFAEVDNE